ncbi:hypothetical protein HYQ44_003929 [Verticillium longisporum]|nr:hypothetical protein HYQ44_003929 [Verticillium longisporum]
MATPTEFKIEPDIDYFTIHRDEEKKENRRSMISRVKSTPPRALSIGKSISRNSTLRRSMSIFKGFHGPAEPTDPTPRKSSYHEIVVHGYGNGTNSVNMNAMSPVDVVEEQCRVDRRQQRWLHRHRSIVGPSNEPEDCIGNYCIRVKRRKLTTYPQSDPDPGPST